MVETWYEVCDRYGMKMAVLADIHARKVNEFMTILRKNHPDFIIIPGDFVDGSRIEKSKIHKEYVQAAINLLNRISQIAPTYVSIGNHEKHFYDAEIEELNNSNAVILQEQFVNVRSDLFIGGLSSGKNYYGDSEYCKPNMEFVKCFEQLQGFKILLSHHPEYYELYLKNKKIDLMVSGHAHGGQIRLFNRGLYAPDQGLLPKYTNGIYDGRLIVSRGIAGTEWVPRINNKPEVVFISI